MNKMIKERAMGVAGLILMVIFLIWIKKNPTYPLITLGMAYSLWFGAYVENLGRKAKKEAGL